MVFGSKTLLISFISLFFFTAVLPARAQDESFTDESLEGEIVELKNEERLDPNGEKHLLQILNVKIYKGSLRGETIEVVNDTVSITSAQEFKKGDKVAVLYTKNVFDGQDIFYITDYVRRDGLLMLFVVFAVMAVAVGGIWGATSLIGMAFSFLVIFKVVLPQIIDGKDAVFAAIIGSAIIVPVTFSLSHGIKKKTWIAGAGTVLSLIITGIIAALAVKLTKLTGFGSEEAAFLQIQLGEAVDMRGLLLAGMIISSLGVLDDITISQASVVAELKKANKRYSLRTLFSRGMNVGRDHIASLINTLVLVYAGASLPLLLLFINNPSPFSEVVNMEMIAEEIVRTLVGSMGLMLAVPITTLLAAFYYQKN